MTDLKTLQPGDPAHLAAAFELVGLKEIVGGKHEPQVLEFFADAGHAWVKDDETAWCAAFAHSMLGRAGIKGTGSLAARSYLEWGTPTDAPRRGDIVVFKRGSSAWQGHVAFYLFTQGERVWVIGGNQSNSVSVTSFAKASVLGYRRPAKASAAGQVPAKPKPAAKATGTDKAASPALVEQVQRALIEKGYNEVGKPDGKYGSKTRGAILAFEADRGLDLTGVVTPELWEEINRAEPREVAPERAEGKPKDNPALKASTGQITVGTVLGGGSLLGIADPIVKNFEGGASLIARVKGAMEPIIELWPLIALGAAALVIYLALRSRKAVVEDYRSGKLAR